MLNAVMHELAPCTIVRDTRRKPTFYIHFAYLESFQIMLLTR